MHSARRSKDPSKGTLWKLRQFGLHPFGQAGARIEPVKSRGHSEHMLEVWRWRFGMRRELLLRMGDK